MPRRPEKSNRPAKDGGFFATNAEAQFRKNRKQTYYTPSNEDGEALHGLIGLKNSIPGFARGGSDGRRRWLGGVSRSFDFAPREAWRCAQDDGAFFGGFRQGKRRYEA